VREGGIGNTSLDLMLWLPEQTLADWQATVDGLIALGPDHASLYLLELYPNAPLREEMARARWSLAPDDDAADMYLWALERSGVGGVQPVRNLQRRPSRTAIPPQPEVLGGRRVAWLRLRRALDARGPAVEECRADVGLHRQDGRWRGASR
jgi:hypothetical protein